MKYSMNALSLWAYEDMVMIYQKIIGFFNKDNASKVIALLIIFALILTIGAIYCFYKSSDVTWDVYNFYLQAEALKSGLRPYSDFYLEFPPASIYVFLIPSLFTSDYDAYRAIFSIIVAIFSLMTAYVVAKICENHGKNPVLPMIAFIVFVCAFFSADFFIKFDIVPTFLSILGIYLYDKGMKKSSYGCLMLGALIKLYPALILLILFIRNLSTHNINLKTLFYEIKNLIIPCSIVFVIVILPYIIMGVNLADLKMFISTQMNRGFHVESFIGSLSIFLGSLGFFEYNISPSMGTSDVISIVSDILTPVWGIIMFIIMCIGLLIVALAQRKSDNFSINIVSSALILLMFILSNYVFSTQYLIWLFPFVSLMMVFTKNGMIITKLFLIAEILSTYALYLSNFNFGFGIVEMFRNILLLYIVVQLIRSTEIFEKKNEFLIPHQT